MYLRKEFTCFILSERHNYAYLLLMWNSKLFEIGPITNNTNIRRWLS